MMEAFVITNGRSTFNYSIRSLEEQDKKIKITVIRDMKWVDAVNECIKLCESPYFVRVDDDMFLHPLCISYMHEMISKKKKKICAYSYRLWEDWQNKIAGRVKVYNKSLVKRMGGFTANKFGKIDKNFSAVAHKRKFRIRKDSSIVGIHACGSWAEQQRYREIWATENATVRLIRPKKYLRSQKKYKKELDTQYSILRKLKKKNKQMKTNFYAFMGG